MPIHSKLWFFLPKTIFWHFLHTWAFSMIKWKASYRSILPNFPSKSLIHEMLHMADPMEYFCAISIVGKYASRLLSKLIVFSQQPVLLQLDELCGTFSFLLKPLLREAHVIDPWNPNSRYYCSPMGTTQTESIAIKEISQGNKLSLSS